MTDERSPRPMVLFIGGSGRSGSTLLDRLLGRSPGFVGVGELRYLWREALTDLRPCGCGARFRACPFWSAVGRVAYGGWDRIDLEAISRLERSVARQRHLPMLRSPSHWSSFERRLVAYVEVLGSLYEAIAAVSGARVIVDSTKDPAHGYLLTHVPQVSVAMVHLVRDSRGVAFSWNKPVEPRRDGEDDALTRRFAPPVSAARWLVYNRLIEGLVKRTDGMLVRYEDLVRAPGRVLSEIAEHAGAPPSFDTKEDPVHTGPFSLAVDHTVAGNPMRMGTGAIDLRIDDEWTRSMKRSDRALVLAITWPLMRRYGYVPSQRFAVPIGGNQ